MQLWGRTTAGKQRYRCATCHVTATVRRPDSRQRVYQKLLVEWLTLSTHLSDIAKRNHCTVRTLWNHFERLWEFEPIPSRRQPRIIAIDGVGIVRHALVALVAQDVERSEPVWWQFATHESYGHWLLTLRAMRSKGICPAYAVSDGQRGLTKALHVVWPNIKLQRCLTHVDRQARAWLTKSPQSAAGRALLLILGQLFDIRTRRQKRRWLRSYRRWRKKHDTFLKERTTGVRTKRRWWYTHRKLRAVRSLISNSLPHLFTFVRYPEVPRTSNHIEGGVNSRLKDLLRIHRGMPAHHRRVLTAWYLARRQGQKPTRNFY